MHDQFVANEDEKYDQGLALDPAPISELPESYSELPESFTFKADVESVYAEKYVLVVTNGQGGEASLEFEKSAVSFEGQDEIDLVEGYKGISFTVPYDLAVEKHLPEFIGREPLPCLPPDPLAVEPVVPEPLAVEPVAPDPSDDDWGSELPGHLHDSYFLRKETVVAMVTLSEVEKNECAKRIVDALSQEAGHKAHASFYNSQARDARKKADTAANIFTAGQEERRVDCYVIADFSTGEAVYVERNEPYREIMRTALSENDRHLRLPGTEEVALSTSDSPDSPDASLVSVTLDADEIADGETVHDETVHDETVHDETVHDETVHGEHEKGEREKDVKQEDPDELTSETNRYTKPERSCGTCVHMHQPEEGETSPCDECGQDLALPNWTEFLPIDALTHQSASVL